MKKLLCILVFVLGISSVAWADDTDIYGVSRIDIKPNVLLIFDNSGSMRTNDVPGEAYDPNTDYTISGSSYTKNWVYKYQDYQWKTYFKDDFSTSNSWVCSPARTGLSGNGYYQGRIKKNNGVVTCNNGGQYRQLRTGNFLNYDDRNLGDTRTRMAVAKEVVANLVYANKEDVRFGLMKFNHNDGGYVVRACGEDNSTQLIGGYVPGRVMTDSDQSGVYGAVGGMRSQTWTPLAETLAEAGRYFSGQKSWFNGKRSTGFPVGSVSDNCEAGSTSSCGDYSGASPIEYRCQNNYIIVVTDGEPTTDGNYRLGPVTGLSGNRSRENPSGTDRSVAFINGVKIPGQAADNDSSSYMDDIAAVLQNTDLLPLPSRATKEDRVKYGEAGDFEKQTVKTYTIGFVDEVGILKSTAVNGGGEYYKADNVSTLNEALNNIINIIKTNNESYTAASVPVSKANKAYAGNYVYYGLFQPAVQGTWTGNVKKYGITDSGVIKDASTPPKDAISGGVVANNARSYWSESIDGPSVISGGVGSVLLDAIEGGFKRNLYTYTGSNSSLTDVSNQFKTTNTSLSSLTTATIDAVRKEDSDWPIASVLHSQPAVVHYDNNSDGIDDESVIYVGANGGMLHAFADTTGMELWGFVPPDLWGNLDSLVSPTELVYFVDGTPVFDEWRDSNNVLHKMLFFGERRGGYSYTALDVTNKTSPSYMYSINRNILGDTKEQLGQSWGEPKKIRIVTQKKTAILEQKTVDAFLLPGGYDSNQDIGQKNSALSPAATDSMGRALFAFERKTGGLLDSFTFYPDSDSDSDHYFPFSHSVIAADGFENPRSRNTTRIYAGDLQGNIWAFRDDIYHHNKDQDKLSVYGGYDYEEDGVFAQRIKLYSSRTDSGSPQKIFYEPTITNEYWDVPVFYPADTVLGTSERWKDERRIGDYVLYGTGDRAFPERKDIKNSFYALKNPWRWKNSDGSGFDGRPDIVKAVFNSSDGSIRDKATNEIIVAEQRDSEGNFIGGVSATKLFILDNTSNIFQPINVSGEPLKRIRTFAKDALNHPMNAGWYLDFVDDNSNKNGEKIVSTPTVYAGTIYFTTYVPEVEVTDPDEVVDACASPGASGTGRLYMLDYLTGSAVKDNDTTTTGLSGRKDRYTTLQGQGIPPEQVLVVHKGKDTIVVGFETEEPVDQSRVQSYYWRQLRSN